MTYVRKLLVAGIGAVSLLGAASTGAGAHDGGTLIEFDSMTPVTGPAVAAVNDRGITGGGLPWMVTSGSGEVDRQGNLEVTVKGLVLAAGPKAGTNPLTPFNAVISCLTPHGIVNVPSAGSPASMAGDSTINAKVALPHPCKDPQVFVGFTNPATGAFIWFAMSNPDEHGENQ